MEIFEYSNYLKQNGTLGFEDAVKLLHKIKKEIGNDKTAMEIYTEICEKAVRYSGFRSKWLLMSKEEKADVDPSRSACHNSLIICVNKLATILKDERKGSSMAR